MQLLGVDPAHIDPWLPADSLVWGKLMALELAGNMNVEWLRYQLVGAAGLSYDHVQEIVAPFNTSRFPTVLTVEDLNSTDLRDRLFTVDAAAAEDSDAVKAFVESYRGNVGQAQTQAHAATSSEEERATAEPKATTPPGGFRLFRGTSGAHGGYSLGASNNWVIGGSFTQTGKPMLANDPHLQLMAPSIWVATHLNVTVREQPPRPPPQTKTADAEEDMDCWGAAFAGLPGIVTGRNAHIAWGVTNTGVDIQDLFVMDEDDDADETTSAARRYKWHGEWTDYTTRTETIAVKGQPDVVITVRGSKAGVVITDNDVAEQLGLDSDVAALNDRTVALSWVPIEPTVEDGSVSAFLAINRAQDFEGFRNALRTFVAPAQNFIFADHAGNIGYQMPGVVPRRAAGHTGLFPVAGNGSWAWQRDGDANHTLSRVLFDDMPRAYNPPKDFFASANNRVTPPRPDGTGDAFAKPGKRETTPEPPRAHTHTHDTTRTHTPHPCSLVTPLTAISRLPPPPPPSPPPPTVTSGYVLSHDWDGSNMGYRSRRITQMILAGQGKTNHSGGGRFDIAGMKAIQLDYKSGLWEDFSPYLTAMLATKAVSLSPAAAAWAEALVQFGGEMAVNTEEPTIFTKWIFGVLELISHVSTPTSADADAGDVKTYLPRRLFNVIWVLDAMEHGDPACGGQGAPVDCLRFAAKALEDAVKPYLLPGGAKPSNAHDDDSAANLMKTPRWGVDVHRALFEHQILHVTPVACAADRVVEHGGDDSTVNVGHVSNADGDMAQVAGPSYRHLVDLDAPDAQSVFLNPLGQSGDPFNRLYDNLLDMWSQGLYLRMGQGGGKVGHRGVNLS